MRIARKLGVGTIPALLFVVVMVLSSCGGPATGPTNSGQKASADKQVFNWPLVGIADIKTFDPAMATTQTSLQAINMSFTGMVGLDANLKVIPQMAESWTTSSDGLTYTFKLKPNLKFSDGTALTSKEIAYSIDRALQPSLKSPASPSYLNLIKDSDKLLDGKIKTIIGDSVKTPDANTVVITISKPVAYFLATMTYSTAFVVNPKLIEKYGNTNFTDHLQEGGSTGPFMVQEYAHGQRIVFVPNPNYFGPKPQLQKVVMPFIKDAQTAYKNYQNGAIDQAGVPTPQLDQAKKLTKEYHMVPVLSTTYYGMNFLAKPFDNVNIRKAFALAINKDAIVQAVYKGVDVPTNNIVPKGMPGYNPNLKGPDGTSSTKGNPEMAKQLLQQGMKEAGYKSVADLPPIRFNYQSGSPDLDNEVAAAVQQWQTVLGVSVKASPTDFETLSAQQVQTVGNTTLQFYFAIWGADYPDPQDFLTLQFSKDSPNNGTNYGQNKSADATQQVQVQGQLIKADTEKDPAKRMQMYNDAEQQLVNDVAWMPVYQLARSRLLKPYVVGRTFNAGDFTPPDDWAKIYIAVH